MTIPPLFMDELRNRLTLSDIIGKRVQLKRAGREFSGCCPFHNEKTPSFTVNDDKQFYHCFGCGAHGDVIDFIMQHDNVSFIDALEMLAAEAGMQVPKQSPQAIEKAKKQKDIYALIEDTASYFEKCLRDPVNSDALGYLHERGMSDELLSSFRIGYAPSDGHALRKHLLNLGYTDRQMMEAQITVESKHGKEPFSFFRERVMFPVADRRGRIVAFGGRILPDHLRAPDRGDYKPAKYMNSRESDVFHKGRMLYGESHARQAASDGQPVIVVEGYVDVMACFSAGYKGAVAPLGTALTPEQIMILWKMIPDTLKEPVMCFDGDAAGRRAAARACANLLPLLAPNQSAKFIFLPEGQDPDSLISSGGKKAFDAVMGSALSLSDFLWEHHTAGKTFKTPEQRAGLAAVLEQEADRIGDRSVQQYYKQAFRERLYNTFGPQYNKNRKGNWKQQQGMQRPQAANIPVRRPVFADSRLVSEQVLLCAVINHPGIFDDVEEALGGFVCRNGRLDLLRQAVINALASDSNLDSEGLQGHLSSLGFDAELRIVLSEAVYTHAGFARAGTEQHKVLEAWRETWRFAEKKEVWNELKMAGKALAEDFSEDNERKIAALYDMQKESEG